MSLVIIVIGADSVTSIREGGRTIFQSEAFHGEMFDVVAVLDMDEFDDIEQTRPYLESLRRLRDDVVVLAATGKHQRDVSDISSHIRGVVRKPDVQSFDAWRATVSPFLSLNAATSTS